MSPAPRQCWASASGSAVCEASSARARARWLCFSTSGSRPMFTASRTRSWYGSIVSVRRAPAVRTRFAARRTETRRVSSPKSILAAVAATSCGRGAPATTVSSRKRRVPASRRAMRARSASWSRRGPALSPSRSLWRTSSSMKSGCPPASAATASAFTSAPAPALRRIASVSARASAGGSASIWMRRTSPVNIPSISSTLRSESASPRASARRASEVKALRSVAMRSRRGAPGWRITSTSSARLSASAHWRSSMARTRGRCSARRVKRSRSAKKRRARRTCGSSAPGAGRGAVATASMRRMTGKIWPMRPRWRGRMAWTSPSSSVVSQRLSASTMPSTALYGTLSRS